MWKILQTFTISNPIIRVIQEWDNWFFVIGSFSQLFWTKDEDVLKFKFS
jgi:hypothetical protein